MSNLPLQPIEWREYGNINGTSVDAITPICEYDIYLSNNEPSYIVAYYNRHTEAPTKEATGFATIDEAKTWAWNHYNEKMQPYINEPKDTITDIKAWFQAAKPKPTDKDVSVQTGCLLEEVVELLEGFGFAKQGAVLELHNLAGLFKANTFGSMIAGLTKNERIEIVDACCDINVTSVGVMQLLGGVDVLGAQREVIRSNNSKMVDGKFIFDDNGKIMKAEGYSKPDLTPFVK